MASISTVFMILQVSCTILALIFNSFLIYVIIRFTKSKLGFYKYILINFALFEMIYALVVLIGMPINFVAENSWIVFTHNYLIGDTSFNWLGPTLYCTFYELWIGLVVVHFVYRYIVVCRTELGQKTQDSIWLQLGIIFLYASHVIYSFVCGLFFCTREEMTKHLITTIEHDFEVENASNLGYTLIRIQKLNGEFSLLGFTALMNHYLLVGVSFTIISFCGYNVWKTICQLQKRREQMREMTLQKQMFFTLLIQTVIPIFLCHTPSLIYLTFPFWDKSMSFGGFASVFSFLTSVPKFLDPIVALLCIREYRHATKRLIFDRIRIGSLTSGTTNSPLPPISQQTSNQTSNSTSNKQIEKF